MKFSVFAVLFVISCSSNQTELRQGSSQSSDAAAEVTDGEPKKEEKLGSYEKPVHIDDPFLAEDEDEKIENEDEKVELEVITAKPKELLFDCSNDAVTKIYSKQLVFPKDDTACDYSKTPENLKNTGKHIWAYQSYIKEMDLKDTIATLCSFNIKTENKYSKFDDDITFTLLNYIVASDFLQRNWFKTVGGLEEKEGLVVFDSSKLIGKEQNSPEMKAWLEAGVDGEISTRQREDSQREGKIDFAITTDFAKKLSDQDLQASKIPFGFHIWGNGDKTDCTHSGFTFDVQISYIPQSALGK